MPSHPRNMPEQEHSIKARSHELYVEEDLTGSSMATKPFQVYLRETPAHPLSPAIKVIFWVLGLVVAVLFLLALWRVWQRHAARPLVDVESAKSVDARPPDDAEPSGTR